ncbi:ABC transporter permease [Bacillus timonensis]|nr:ABC transporter permease [Bacillus timonensis]
MNIFKRELKANRKSLILWSLGVVFLILSSMGKYSSLSTTGQSMNDLMASMPKSLQSIMGTGSFDLSEPIGYFGLLYLYVIVMATIHAAMLGANMLSKEERDKTSEFLLVKPITRQYIITSKLIAALVNVLLFNFVTFIASFIMVQNAGPEESVIREIVLLMMGMFILQLIFLSVGTAVAAITKRPKRANSIATGILLVTFILSIIINLDSRLEPLAYFTPFKYFEAETLLSGEGFGLAYVFLSMLLIILLTLCSYSVYGKRDLNI